MSEDASNCKMGTCEVERPWTILHMKDDLLVSNQVCLNSCGEKLIVFDDLFV